MIEKHTWHCPSSNSQTCLKKTRVLEWISQNRSRTGSAHISPQNQKTKVSTYTDVFISKTQTSHIHYFKQL